MLEKFLSPHYPATVSLLFLHLDGFVHTEFVILPWLQETKEAVMA